MDPTQCHRISYRAKICNMTKKDSPRVYVPPPMIYAAVFGLASMTQTHYPINVSIFNYHNLRYLGWTMIILALGIILPSLWRFWKSKNTLITIRSANSLQTSGIYGLTRNPMYLALMILYLGLACFSKNCWTLIFLPLLIIIIQNYVISREEQYLERTFKDEYTRYRLKVRRWI